MRTIVLIIIGIPLIEIFIMIKIGGMIGALNTLLFILLTAVTGLYFVKLAGLNQFRSAVGKILNNETPFYELISGATLIFAALLLIIPGFLTDLIGFLLIIPYSRKFFIKLFSKKQFKNKSFVEGEFEELDNDEDKKNDI